MGKTKSCLFHSNEIIDKDIGKVGQNTFRNAHTYFEPFDLVFGIHGDELAAHVEVPELDGDEERDVSLRVRLHPDLLWALLQQLFQNW